MAAGSRGTRPPAVYGVLTVLAGLKDVVIAAIITHLPIVGGAGFLVMLLDAHWAMTGVQQHTGPTYGRHTPRSWLRPSLFYTPALCATVLRRGLAGGATTRGRKPYPGIATAKDRNP